MRHPELQREKEPFSVTLPGSPHPELKSGTYPVQLRLTPAQLPTVKLFWTVFKYGGSLTCHWKISEEHVTGSPWIPPTPTRPRLLSGDLVLGAHDPPYTEREGGRKLCPWTNRLRLPSALRPSL